MSGSQFGMIGLGTMGRNLALNIEDHGYSVAVWNREPEWVADFLKDHAGGKFEGTTTLEAFIAALERPRRIMMMIPAGKPVDDMIEKLKPLVEPGDILIDGGNSWFEDTRRREAALRDAGIHFIGCGVSGGEEGARFGPSLMPGGPADAWPLVRDVLEAIAAKTEAGPCVTHVGPDGAGHFVKMVHNGIEYGDMQLLAESWDVMRRGLGMTAPETADLFDVWNAGALESFLTELTAKVCRKLDEHTGKPLVDMVLDRAAQKGTGKWTAQVALDLAVPIPTIAAALDGRVLSSMKDERVAASKVLNGPDSLARFGRDDRQQVIDDLRDALYAARICAYAQGMALIRAGSDAYNWNVDLAEIGRIWNGGCIIRARLLDPVRHAFAAQPALKNLLLDPGLGDVVEAVQSGWRRTVARAAEAGLPFQAHTASLAYFDSYRAERLPQSLTQGQRDAFGAHTYERIDRPGAVHTEWL
ncbi:MAG: NADP-dependent phosphogluconate dehydrogenase [Acidobacteriota bacterium]